MSIGFDIKTKVVTSQSELDIPCSSGCLTGSLTLTTYSTCRIKFRKRKALQVK